MCVLDKQAKELHDKGWASRGRSESDLLSLA